VFARTIGMPTDPIEATGELVDALHRRSLPRIGLGSVNGRYFLFHVGMGYDAAVVAQVERRPSLKRYVSQAIFVYASLTAWFRHYDHSRPRLSVRFPDGSEVPDGYFTICLNSNPYTYLGPRPLNLAPGVGFDDPLAVVTLTTLAARSLLGAVGTAVVGKGGVQGRRGVDYRPGVDRLEVVGHGPFPYQVDGDHLGDVETLSLRHEPAVLDLVVPADLSDGAVAGADGGALPDDGPAPGRSA
jgi:diacylglycerol kinase family enzyme